MRKITIDERWLRSAAWVLVCALITGGAMLLSVLLVEHGPEAPKAAPERALPVVLVAEVEVTTVEVEIAAHGEVRPARRTTLSAEVGGRLEMVHEAFEAGEVFAEGEMLVQIDAADYNSALAAAEATLADAELALQLEESRRDQALRDWAKLGSGREPSDLVRRVPQLASAEAAVTAAQRAVEKARRDVERTSLVAPYDCRIERTYVDLGAVVSPGMQLAEVVSQGPVEVRLALSLEDYGYVQRGEDGRVSGEVTATGTMGGGPRKWTGRLVRSEGLVERSTRSINVVAEFGRDGAEAPLIGMFVTAGIEGISVPGVVKVPRAAMLNGSEVLLVTDEDTLEFRKVEVMRAEAEDLLVSSGLRAGERVVLTPPSVPTPGAPVRVLKDQPPAAPKAGEKKPEKPDEAAAPA